jgi:hypothetical protein
VLVEPGPAEDEFPQPVDERLTVDESQYLPVPDQVAAETAPGLVDAAVGRQLDEVGRLVVVQIVVLDEPELDRGRRHALLEIGRVESKSVTKELDHVVLAR